MATCYNGIGKSVFVDGKMNSKQYQSIPRIGYNTNTDMHDIDRSKLIFQQDNGPKDTSKSAKN